MKKMMPKEIDIVIPVYNEELEIVKKTISDLRLSLKNYCTPNIIIVNDASDEKYRMDLLINDGRIHYIEHAVNKGYGSALKTGIKSGNNEWIAIIDADGTYPALEMAKLYNAIEDGVDMIVGSRVGDICRIPIMRRFPKMILNSLASYMAKRKILDLNSGMRLFRRELCYTCWNLLPNRFSFTSTITMAGITSGKEVKEVPIDYLKRVGSSSIHPIKDTIKFTNIVIKMGMLFYPMRLFAPISLFSFLVGFIKGFFRDFLIQGYFGNISILLLLGSVQILLMGYLGELIVTSRLLNIQYEEKKPH